MVNYLEMRKNVLVEMSSYKLPEKGKISRIFDSIPRIINSTGFDIFDYDKVFEDEPTRKIIREGDTIGCFYIESPGMRSLLRRLNCDTFEMLVAASSVIRPGVAESGMMKEFIERHKDPSRRKYLIPEMEKYLGETYGVMVYQEDVIKVAHHIVGLTLEESDFLRRAMSGKMRSHKAMQMIVDKFFYCCKERGYTDQVAQQLWKQIESFAGYAFCKAHSASFALLSYQVAYLKVHYPAEFMAAVLSNQGGYYSAAVYISETRRLGIKILLPSVNHSEYEYTGLGREMRIGLMAVKHIDESITKRIVLERNKNGGYSSLHDFLNRTGTGYKQSEMLIKCGAMDCFGLTRPSLLRMLDIYFSSRKLISGEGGDLFFEHTIKLADEVGTGLNFTKEEIGINEYEAFEYMATYHPLEFFTAEFGDSKIVKAGEMIKFNNRRVKMIGWYMASKRIKTSKGEIMKFLSLEDLSGTFEAILFPKSYAQYAELTMSMGPYLVEGRVDVDGGNNIVVDKLAVLAAEKAKSITQKEGNNNRFFGDPDNPAELEEMVLINSLDKEKLYKAYVG